MVNHQTQRMYRVPLQHRTEVSSPVAPRFLLPNNLYVFVITLPRLNGDQLTRMILRDMARMSFVQARILTGSSELVGGVSINYGG